jgi:hypothetical protein
MNEGTVSSGLPILRSRGRVCRRPRRRWPMGISQLHKMRMWWRKALPNHGRRASERGLRMEPSAPRHPPGLPGERGGAMNEWDDVLKPWEARMRELRALGRKAGQDWPENGAVEIRPNEEPVGTIDEIVVENASVHVEQMADNAYWMSITANGELWHFWFTCRRGEMSLTGGFEGKLDDLPDCQESGRDR